ncbi:hypothetical protein ACP275_14G224300 [Erythranthe tilingii]
MSTGIQANLWLVYAVKRIGFDDWNAVAKQLDKTGIQHNYLLPPYSAAACKKKYLIVRKRFIDNRSPLTDDEEDDAAADGGKQKVNEEEDEVLDKATEKPLLETMTKVYSQLRQAELRMLLNGDAEARLAKAKKARSKRNKKFAVKDSSKLPLSNSGEPSEKPAEKISAAVEEKPKESAPVVRKIPNSSLTKAGLPTSKEAREHMEIKMESMDLQDRVESDQSAAPPPNAEDKGRIVVLALEAPNNPSRRPSKAKTRNKTQKKKIPKDDPSYNCPGFKAMVQKEEESVIMNKSADGGNEA